MFGRAAPLSSYSLTPLDPVCYATIPLMNQPGPLLDIPSAALRMGVTERFMKRLVEERRIPYFKIGKFIRFSEEDLDDFLIAARILPEREVVERRSKVRTNGVQVPDPNTYSVTDHSRTGT